MTASQENEGTKIHVITSAGQFREFAHLERSRFCFLTEFACFPLQSPGLSLTRVLRVGQDKQFSFSWRVRRAPRARRRRMHARRAHTYTHAHTCLKYVLRIHARTQYLGVDRLRDDLPGLVAEAGGLRPRDGGGGVRVPEERSHLVADERLPNTCVATNTQKAAGKPQAAGAPTHGTLLSTRHSNKKYATRPRTAPAATDTISPRSKRPALNVQQQMRTYGCSTSSNTDSHNGRHSTAAATTATPAAQTTTAAATSATGREAGGANMRQLQAACCVVLHASPLHTSAGADIQKVALREQPTEHSELRQVYGLVKHPTATESPLTPCPEVEQTTEKVIPTYRRIRTIRGFQTGCDTAVGMAHHIINTKMGEQINT